MQQNQNKKIFLFELLYKSHCDVVMLYECTYKFPLTKINVNVYDLKMAAHFSSKTMTH